MRAHLLDHFPVPGSSSGVVGRRSVAVRGGAVDRACVRILSESSNQNLPTAPERAWSRRQKCSVVVVSRPAAFSTQQLPDYSIGEASGFVGGRS